MILCIPLFLSGMPSASAQNSHLLCSQKRPVVHPPFIQVLVANIFVTASGLYPSDRASIHLYGCPGFTSCCIQDGLDWKVTVLLDDARHGLLLSFSLFSSSTVLSYYLLSLSIPNSEALGFIVALRYQHRAHQALRMKQQLTVCFCLIATSTFYAQR